MAAISVLAEDVHPAQEPHAPIIEPSCWIGCVLRYIPFPFLPKKVHFASIFIRPGPALLDDVKANQGVDEIVDHTVNDKVYTIILSLITRAMR
jgi:hypothetical protein